MHSGEQWIICEMERERDIGRQSVCVCVCTRAYACIHAPVETTGERWNGMWWPKPAIYWVSVLFVTSA